MSVELVYVVERWQPGNSASRQTIAAFESRADARRLLMESFGCKEPTLGGTTWTHPSEPDAPSYHYAIVNVPFSRLGVRA